VGRAHSKTVVERLTQAMVLQHYLEEDSVELASGFAANYVNVRGVLCFVVVWFICVFVCVCVCVSICFVCGLVWLEGVTGLCVDQIVMVGRFVGLCRVTHHPHHHPPNPTITPSPPPPTKTQLGPKAEELMNNQQATLQLTFRSAGTKASKAAAAAAAAAADEEEAGGGGGGKGKGKGAKKKRAPRKPRQRKQAAGAGGSQGQRGKGKAGAVAGKGTGRAMDVLDLTAEEEDGVGVC
jgi:hypothetical protein